MDLAERQVIGAVRARLTDTGSAPLAALTQTCHADPAGTWKPFEEAVRAEARRLGVSWAPIPATGRYVLSGCGLTVLATVAAAAASVALAGPGHAHPVGAAVAALVAIWIGFGCLSRRDKLTPAGQDLAARWQDPAAAAGNRAFAVAAGHAQVTGSPGQAAKAARPRENTRPDSAWSALSGTWRQLQIGKNPATGTLGSGIAMLGGAAWLALITAVLAMFSGSVAELSLVAAFATVGLGVFGIHRLVEVAGTPKEAVFDGQVIARWTESGDEGGTLHYVAVDDSVRAWTFDGAQIFNRTALGDLVRVRVNPRSGGLIDLTLTGSPRKSQPPPLQPLLTAAEAASVTGPLKPRGLAGPMIFQGTRGSLTLVLMDGKVAAWNASHARRRGIPLPGIGDCAWQRNGGRVIVVSVRDQVIKLLLSRDGQRQNLPALAGLVASRLAARPADEIRAPGSS